MGSVIGQLRRKIAFGDYELTGHAKDEMEQDGLTIQDVKTALYNGKIAARQRHGVGRRKLVVSGRARDGRGVRIVCRFTESGRVRVITVFVE